METIHLHTIREWKGIKVLEATLPESVHGFSLPWKDTGEYRICINARMSEREKLETFIHEMIHLYRGDHGDTERLDRIETDCHRTTEEIMEKLGL